MLLGQLVAISFSTSLFLVALSLRPRVRQISANRAAILVVPLLGAIVTIYRSPSLVNTEEFMLNLLAMHGLLLLPLFVPAKASNAPSAETGMARIEYPIYAALVGAAGLIHKLNTDSFFSSLKDQSAFVTARQAMYSHPAQGSISFDVIWVLITLFCWFFSTGSWTTLGLKSVGLAGAAFTTWIRHTGINWTFVASVAPILGLGSVGIAIFALNRLRARNEVKRKVFMEKIGVVEENVVPGTDKSPPSFAPRRTLAGFWHPYW